MKKKKNKHTCCEKCQHYWTCETKWYRGEAGEENICCAICNYYAECWVASSKKVPARKTK